jgi:hypothetical protein
LVWIDLVHIGVQRITGAQRSGDRRDYLSDHAVQVGVGGTRDIRVALAGLIDGIVVELERAIAAIESISNE